MYIPLCVSVDYWRSLVTISDPFFSSFFELITSLILSLPVLGGGIMVSDSINTAWIRWDLDLFVWFPSYDRCQARICMQRIGRSRLKGPINAEAVGSPVEDEWKLQINRLLRESSISPSEEHCWCEAVHTTRCKMIPDVTCKTRC